MKKLPKHPLIKDLLIIVILGGFMLFMANALNDGNPPAIDLFLCFAITGIPFGWKWANKLFVALTFKGFVLKVVWAACLGCVAIFVVVIRDLVDFIKCRKEAVTEK